MRSFTNSRDVLAALEDDEPQVLVSDIRMPGGSGIDLLNKIKAKHRELPVIIMTAYSDLDSAVSAFQGGAFDYLPKPFDVPKAVDLIRRAVEESLHEGGERRAGRAGARDPRPGAGDAGRLSRDRAAAARASSPSSSPASRDRARSSSPTRCTSTARARAARSSRSTPPRSRRTCSSPSCSATSAAPSPARRRRGAAASSRPTAARSSSTRSATCRSTCRRGCCASSPTASSIASAATTR